MARMDFRRLSLMTAALAAVGALSACGPGGSSSTTVVLVGPPDKVDALIARHKLLAPPVQAQKDRLEDGRERARLRLPRGLPMGEMIDLGKEAARDGVNFEVSSGTKWGSDATPPTDPALQGPASADPAPQDPAKPPPRRAGGPVA